MKSEIYFYYDDPYDRVVLGTRGVSEYKMERLKFEKEVLRRRIDCIFDRDKQLRAMLKLVIQESQYVDFEEVKPNIILLGVENTGVDTNETKYYSE